MALCDGGSVLRWTHPREAMECTLCLTAFVGIICTPLVLLKMFHLQMAYSIGRSPPSAVGYREDTALVLRLDFHHSWWLEEIPNGTCTLSICHGYLLVSRSRLSRATVLL